MKLTYWVIDTLDDSPCYNIRARTKRECKAMAAMLGDHYGEPRKVEFEYADAFDLVTSALSEGGQSYIEGVP